MKIIIIKSRYMTNKTAIDLFEGNLDEFITYCVDNFKDWFLGNESSCESLAKYIVKEFNEIKGPRYVMEVAAWFKLVEE